MTTGIWRIAPAEITTRLGRLWCGARDMRHRYGTPSLWNRTVWRLSRVGHHLPALGLLAAMAPALAAEPPADLSICASIVEREQRLECFDQLAAGTGVDAPLTSPLATPQGARPTTPSRTPEPEPGTDFSISKHWELGPDDKRGVFAFRPHRDNYLLFANFISNPNVAPYAPFGGLAPGAKFSHTEVAFQLGFKMKLAENPFRLPTDLWFGYTQNSFWQAYNHKASNPFRETDYQPELMAVVPISLSLLGLTARFANFGVVHQSNGQLSTLSRSWNRVYAQIGLERGDLTLLGRVWTGLGAIEDNPDIYDYMGHSDVSVVYRWQGSELSALVRRNFNTGRGAVQGSWAIPLVQHLKAYVQIFSGYGASLIDYNSYQRTAGLGVLVDF